MAQKDCVSVVDFRPGMAISACYTCPSKDRTTVNLKDSNGDVILHMDNRVTYGPQGIALVLNSNLGGKGWGQEQVVKNFCFTPGTLLTLTARAQKDSFSIIANGKEVAQYSYRAPIERVHAVSFSTGADSVLKTISVEYSPQ